MESLSYPVSSDFVQNFHRTSPDQKQKPTVIYQYLTINCPISFDHVPDTTGRNAVPHH